jgi:hypothetical protein
MKIVYFTSNYCGNCKVLQLETLFDELKTQGIEIEIFNREIVGKAIFDENVRHYAIDGSMPNVVLTGAGVNEQIDGALLMDTNTNDTAAKRKYAYDFIRGRIAQKMLSTGIAPPSIKNESTGTKQTGTISLIKEKPKYALIGLGVLCFLALLFWAIRHFYYLKHNK